MIMIVRSIISNNNQVKRMESASIRPQMKELCAMKTCEESDLTRADMKIQERVLKYNPAMFMKFKNK